MYERIAARRDFEAMHEPEANILCFRWVGDGEASDDALDAINLDAARALQSLSGNGWLTTTVLDGRRVLRVTLMNPRTGVEHLDRLLRELAAEAAR